MDTIRYGWRFTAVGAAAAAVMALLGPPAGAAPQANQGREPGDSRVFAVVPAPGNPEAVAVNGNTVVTGTTISGLELATRTASVPSHLYAFDRGSGGLKYAIPVEGEDLSEVHGLAGLAFDGTGRLYAADVQQGVLRFALGTGARRQELYATIPDMPTCLAAVPGRPCSPTLVDRQPLPNEIVFDDAGNLYVTDSWQATIWRIPPGGGEALVWFTDGRLDGLFGANGITISPDRTWVYLAQTYTETLGGALYRLPLVTQPGADDLELLRTWPQAGPDGMAFGRSGRLYLVLGGSEEVAVLDPDGKQVATYRSEHLHNPASPAFDGLGSLLVANHAFFDLDPAHSSLVDLYVADRGAPLSRPLLP